MRGSRLCGEYELVVPQVRLACGLDEEADAVELVAEGCEDVLRFWLDLGVDGFRFDVAHGMAKDLRDPLRELGSGQVHHRIVGDGWDGDHPFWDRDDVHDILRGFRRVTGAYQPPRATVAESWAALDRRALYTRPDELHQAFNFDFLTCPWRADALRVTIDRSLALAATTGAAPSWVLSNHDDVRHASRLSLPPGTDPDEWLLTDGRTPHIDPVRSERRARAAALLLLALPGAAYVYQGDELGLPEVADLPEEVLQDPVRHRSSGARKGRDGCRLPFPWTPTGPSYGFGPGPAWLPQPASYAALCAEAQTRNPHSALSLYRGALHLRRTLLRPEASLRWSSPPQAELLDFNVGGLRCVVNFSEQPVAAPDPDEPLLVSEPLRGAEYGVGPDVAVWFSSTGGRRRTPAPVVRPPYPVA
ncbi:alpha-amylase family glycosyl hydrolase [Streptomyces sp. NPDC055955]|uniref:alpha-amylase family glycosyl hydrolase n=1 Tax=Streptomyces sp. NPDC055955 TaxID=3345665 RepID=UPI0035E08383